MMIDYAEFITTALDRFDGQSARSAQSREGILGPSDIGFCRQKAVLVTKQTKPSDYVPRWAAAVGTSIHTYVEKAIKMSHPDALVGSIDNITVTAQLPSGARISGHPDIVIPSENTVLDIKTVNGFEATKRNGASLSHKYQRHLYAMGCIEAGMFDPAKEVYVGNVYLDRSAKDPNPLVLIDKFDPLLTNEIDSWVQDVIYAVKNGEDASRDVAAAVCESICEFFTVCRGGLAVHEGQEIITDNYLINAIDMYVEGRDMEKQGEQMKKEASEMLSNVNGQTSTHQVRWVQVNPTLVNAFERPGYTRLDVRKVRKGS
jgi:hypothetical protein